MVGISYMVGQSFSLSDLKKKQESNRMFADVFKVTPLRIEVTHLCYDSQAWRIAFAAFQFFSPSKDRIRAQEQFGSNQECLFLLQTHGVPTYQFPVTADGDRTLEPSKQYWKKRQALERWRAQNLEATDAVSKHVSHPRNNDVLLGRGKAAYMHTGNIRFRNMALERLEEYNAPGKYFRKKKICQEIMALIRSRGGRFLKQNEAGWVAVEDEVAIDKVSHMFRTLRRLRKESAASADTCTSTTKRDTATRNSDEDHAAARLNSRQRG